MVRRMQEAVRRGTWSGTAREWERLREQAVGAGVTEDGRGRWAVREIVAVRRCPGRGRLLDARPAARVRWEGGALRDAR